LLDLISQQQNIFDKFAKTIGVSATDPTAAYACMCISTSILQGYC